jgi:hypothetical protein
MKGDFEMWKCECGEVFESPETIDIDADVEIKICPFCCSDKIKYSKELDDIVLEEEWRKYINE